MDESLIRIKLHNGNVLNKGCKFKLLDKVGSLYKQTKFWELSIDNLYPINQYDDKDFKFVKILPTSDNNFIPTHKVLSFFKDEFFFFKEYEDTYFGYSKYLRINIEAAIKHKEIEILTNQDSESTIPTSCRRRWKHVQICLLHFWRRWIKEYLPTLTTRGKWIQEENNLKKGEIVLIETDTKRGQWATWNGC